MRTLVLALGFSLIAVSARAQAIAPADVKAHVGQTVTVEGAVSGVHKIASGMTFIDLGGRFPDNTFTAVILAADAGKFPDANSFDGKTVDITGLVRLYKGRPEIVLNDARQIKTK